MLLKIRLLNFKCFEDEVIELAPFNLLTGLNGMGKSTLIQALLLLRQSYELNLLQQEGILALNGELAQIGNAKDLRYQYAESDEIAIELSSNEYTNMIWKWYSKTDSDYLTQRQNDFAPIRSLKLFPLFPSLFDTNFHYLNAERLGPRAYYDVSTYKVVKRNQLGIKGEFAINYLNEYGDRNIPIEALKHPDTEGLTLYEQVNAWLSEIRPGTRVKTISNPNTSIVSSTYQFIGGRDAGNEFRPTNVGFGLSYIVPILVAVLGSTPGALIILENPEAHLHPKGQTQIGKLLALAAANGLQLIVETHSDHILNGLRVAVKKGLIAPDQTKILFFTGDVIENKFKHYILTPKIDKDGRIDDWPDGFFDEWEKQLTELI
ncbi:ABC transporter permease [Candidatus Magnetoovum chiemensis]|nr:ABC transporter permease [Candidatus Magnetoovum chiemensis]